MPADLAVSLGAHTRQWQEMARHEDDEAKGREHQLRAAQCIDEAIALFEGTSQNFWLVSAYPHGVRVHFPLSEEDAGQPASPRLRSPGRDPTHKKKLSTAGYQLSAKTRGSPRLRSGQAPTPPTRGSYPPAHIRGIRSFVPFVILLASAFIGGPSSSLCLLRVLCVRSAVQASKPRIFRKAMTIAKSATRMTPPPMSSNVGRLFCISAACSARSLCRSSSSTVATASASSAASS